ncbi:MAG: glycosyltransferase family 2 protein [Fimbriimonadaceae bacterium]|nr:glycosyltransferase family 2 protein [Fimbriimonadaceae bacterium]
MALQHELENAQPAPTQHNPALKARYRFFRQCVDDKTVFDASGFPWGANYVTLCAQQVQALVADPVEVISFSSEYSCVDFTPTAPAKACDIYVNLNSVTPDELNAIGKDYAAIIVAWNPSTGDVEAFKSAVTGAFPNKPAQFFSQAENWPHPCTNGLDSDATLWMAAIGDCPEVVWPTVGIAIPTIDNTEDAVFAVNKFIDQYPGQIRFAIVGNGTNDVAWARLQQAANDWGARATLIRNETNQGYGLGCNRGLHALHTAGECEFYAVMNDDVVPAEGCLSEMVLAMRQLDSLGYKPGVVAPLSDNINGCQQIKLPINSVHTLDEDTEAFRREKHSSGRQEVQLRGLLLLIHPDCLKEVGGFDPRFGIGNFEDDDHNLRTRLAGFTLWVAEGAFLHHKGSKTFQKLGIDYNANIQRNGETFGEKWQIMTLEEWPALETYPDDVSLHVPLDFNFDDRHVTKINGEMIDIVHEAGEVEFVAWVMNAMRAHPRAKRREVIDCILALGTNKSA